MKTILAALHASSNRCQCQLKRRKGVQCYYEMCREAHEVTQLMKILLKMQKVAKQTRQKGHVRNTTLSTVF